MERVHVPVAGALATNEPCGIEQAAALTFEPLPVEMPDRARFMDQAAAAFDCVLVGAAVMTVDPAGLAAALKRQGEAGIFQFLAELDECRAWFSGFVRLIDAVEARAFVAASRIALEREPRA